MPFLHIYESSHPYEVTKEAPASVPDPVGALAIDIFPSRTQGQGKVNIGLQGMRSHWCSDGLISHIRFPQHISVAA